MATSFIKSFMEAVNPAAAKTAKKTQNPQDPVGSRGQNDLKRLPMLCWM